MIYKIIVQGCLDPSWSDSFNGLEIINENSINAQITTSFMGNIVDQATLRGILNHLWDLNLTILSVIQIDSQKKLDN